MVDTVQVPSPAEMVTTRVTMPRQKPQLDPKVTYLTIQAMAAHRSLANPGAERLSGKLALDRKKQLKSVQHPSDQSSVETTVQRKSATSHQWLDRRMLDYKTQHPR